ncbi:hypothetical protein [Fluviibacterium sp. S390]|uniref:hypothetical protein n=1 Tax=Fluviibacterium sp. S390 TaxID=3415139 RepID=UPI003C7B45E3
MHHAYRSVIHRCPSLPIDQVRDGAFFWTDEGGSPEDAIHLYGFAWTDPAPGKEAFEQLMRQAVSAIESMITGQT